MGNNSTQGWAVLVFLLSFTLLSISLFYGNNVVFLLLAAGTFAASVVMFRKAKALEHEG